MIGWVFRVIVAAGLLGSAAVHYFLWTQGYPGLTGPLFLLNAVAGLLIAIAVLAWRHWLPALLAVGFGAATLGAYILAVTVGFLGNHDQFNSGPEYAGVITEAACIIFGIGLLVIKDRKGAVSATR